MWKMRAIYIDTARRCPFYVSNNQPVLWHQQTGRSPFGIKTDNEATKTLGASFIDKRKAGVRLNRTWPEAVGFPHIKLFSACRRHSNAEQ